MPRPHPSARLLQPLLRPDSGAALGLRRHLTHLDHIHRDHVAHFSRRKASLRPSPCSPIDHSWRWFHFKAKLLVPKQPGHAPQTNRPFTERN